MDGLSPDPPSVPPLAGNASELMALLNRLAAQASCPHEWFPYWTDRTAYRIEWFCRRCRTWTDSPSG